LSGTQISDAGLEHLRELSSLKGLNLSGTQIGDAGLEHLQGLTSLEFLELGFITNVTDAGREELKAALPECEIQ